MIRVQAARDLRVAASQKVMSYSQIEPIDEVHVNSYRVLLSRGRDGIVRFVPADTQMDATAEALILSGAKPL